MQYTAEDRDILIRTILGEAASESDLGQQAVAHVIANRLRDKRWPNTLREVALQPKQFSAWNAGVGGNDLVRKYGPGTPAYERAAANADLVLTGTTPDPTGGATHYYSPAGMDAHVARGEQTNRLPGWLQSESDRRGGNNVTIGGHVFTGLTNGSPIPQQAQPSPRVRRNEPEGATGGPTLTVLGPPEVPQTQAQADAGVPPMPTDSQVPSEIPKPTTMESLIDEGKSAIVDVGKSALMGLLMGSNRGSTLAPPPPLPLMAPPQVQTGPVMFNIKKKRDKNK